MGATLVPWIRDPFGKRYFAWEIPVDIGWQIHTGILSYGTLCLGCALYLFFIAYARWKNMFWAYRQHRAILYLFCLLPVLLFLLQYLFVDLNTISLMAQHKLQILLIQKHFDYKVQNAVFPIRPFLLDISTLNGRIQLLAGQISFGILFPCFSIICLILYRQPISARNLTSTWRRRALISLVAAIIVVFLSRAPLGMLCENQAQVALSTGDYMQALSWLDKADTLNPSLEQVAYYHIARGEASYALDHNQQSDDIQAYLASTYSAQGDDLDAYQQLLIVWQSHQASAWVIEEISTILEKLAESTQPQKNQSAVLDVRNVSFLKNDYITLPWLKRLIQVDGTNVYSTYVIGRIEYDLKNYAGCITQMSISTHLSTDENLQSSEYTFMALSEDGLGNYQDARVLLFDAVQLDPGFHNITAREELSGLR